MTFKYFTGIKGEWQKRVTVHISIDRELPILKFEVDLGEIPVKADDGSEVVVNFKVENFDNGDVFYTDSNGLDM